MDKASQKLLSDFESKCVSEDLSETRVRKYRYTVRTISKMLKKPFSVVTRKDLEGLLIRINRSDYSEWTKRDYKVTLRKFWRFLGKEELVSWIKTTMKRNELPLPNLLAREELMQLVQACKTVRDKALLYALFESGARIDELLSVKLCEIEFDSYGAVLLINNSKTKARRLRVCGQAVDYLKEWANVNHPTKQPDSLLFPISYPAMRKNLKNIVKRAGLVKRVHFHMFRHGRATELARELTEAELNVFMGWEQGSNMPRTYVHLSGKDLDKKILQISGIGKEQKVENAMCQIKVKDAELYRALMRFVSKEMKGG